MQHLCEIMVMNLKSSTGTSDFMSHIIKCNTCHKLSHYLCTIVNSHASFMHEVAHSCYYDYYFDALAIILTGILTGLVLSSNGICFNTQLSVKVNIFFIC